MFPAPLPVSRKGPCVHASHRNSSCLCPVGDHMCAHPSGDHACLHPTGKHAYVHPTGTLGHVCQVIPLQEQLRIPVPAPFPQASTFR